MRKPNYESCRQKITKNYNIKEHLFRCIETKTTRPPFRYNIYGKWSKSQKWPQTTTRRDEHLT